MNRSGVFRYWYFTPGAFQIQELPRHLEDRLMELPEQLSSDGDHDLVVATCSELLSDQGTVLPAWVGTTCRFLVLMDVPEPAVLRLPSLLGLHKPEQRLHVTRDPGAVRRMIVALLRDQAWEGIVDAYVLRDQLVAVLGDLSVREFPQKRLPKLRDLPSGRFANFEIDSSGSYLYWKDADVHLGPPQMLQAVDPMYLAEVEIRRYATQRTSQALLKMREERGLTQSQVAGLSERQVRRLEKEESRFTADAARTYAAAFGQSVPEFLRELSQRVSELRGPDSSGQPVSHHDGDQPGHAHVA